MKVCLISTVGGHLTQLLKLAEGTRGHDAYLVSVPSPHSDSALANFRHFYVKQILRNPVNLIVNAAQSLRLFLRERPDAIVTTGAGDALPTVLLGAALGRRVLFLESFARVHQPSLFGRLVRRWCDLVMYQWPSLNGAYPRGICVSPLFRLVARGKLPASPSVLVLTGTHTIGFDRLLRAIDDLVGRGRLTNRITVQIGHSLYVPKNVEYFRFLPHEELIERLEGADIVITHDGSASIGESLSLGKPTIVVPREASRGEVSYGSDQQLARQLSDLGYVTLVTEPEMIPIALTRIGAETIPPTAPDRPEAIELVNDFLSSLRRSSRSLPRGGHDPLSVTIVTPISPWAERPSGIKTYSASLVSSLAAAGIQVLVATVGRPPAEPQPGVTPLILTTRRVSSIGFLAVLFLNGSKLAGRQSILHFQRADHVVALLPWALANPKVVTLHGESTRSIRIRRGVFQASIFTIGEMLGTKFSDALIAVSRKTREDYEKRFPWVRGKIEEIPVGATPLESDEAESHADFPSIPSGVKLIVYAGRLEPEKNVALLIDSVQLVRSVFPDAVVLIVGEGGLEDELRKRAGQVEGGVQFIHTLSRGELFELLKRADALAIPSAFESGPLVALEALALGTPVVTTPVGVIAEIATRWQVGRVVPPNASHFGRAIVEVLSSGKSHYLEACMSATKELSFKNTFDRTLSLYNAIWAKVGS